MTEQPKVAVGERRVRPVVDPRPSGAFGRRRLKRKGQRRPRGRRLSDLALAQERVRLTDAVMERKGREGDLCVQIVKFSTRWSTGSRIRRTRKRALRRSAQASPPESAPATSP